jgi:penicillin amidase
MKYIKALIALIFTIGFVYALNRPWGPVPALGSFLSPFSGFWQNGENPILISQDDQVLKLDSLEKEVIIRVDDMGVPHIFATNNHDLYFAQGYITAKDRLWQMDLQTRAASGRLSEVLGDVTLEMDKKNRRLGMGYGAEANLKEAMQNPIAREATLAYAAGVNAYIDQLSPRNYPIEFKLLGYRPEPWKPINTYYMLEQMTLTLAGQSNELNMTKILKQYGQQVVQDLFPDYPKLQESPIIPSETKWDFKKQPIPITSPISDVTNLITSINQSAPKEIQPKVEGLGSNNWAIAANKSATGYPILANDPHLELTLPSIWYQVQLHSPDVNVYGVSLPGIPTVIIGYNNRIAWGVTNVDADVYDLYKIKFKDDSRTSYWHDNQWKNTTVREELIYVKGQKDPIKEQIVYTHHGPVTEKSTEEITTSDLAVRWIGHETGVSLMTFYELNRAMNYQDYRAALAKYVGPAQNFVFADNAKDIAITVNGKLPLKYKNQGKFLLDGTQIGDDWQGWIPPDQNPYVKNPARGFVSSANQSSTDPTYPYYINWIFAPSERGIRINERLSAMTQANADSLRILQSDNFSVMARTILPKLLSVLNEIALTPPQKEAWKILAAWNFRNDADLVAPSIFETWIPTLREAIWADEFSGIAKISDYPTRDRTEYLIIHQPNEKWFDNVHTPQKETMPDIVFLSFAQSLDTLTARHGPMSETNWKWSKVKNSSIRHLSKALKPFDAPPIITGGGGSIVNAMTKHHGPSWRMVVELGPTPRAFGVYPGGQSGNPGSPYYLNLLKKWEQGELYELIFLQSANDKNDRIIASIKLESK